ncbi:MAG TPA: hypothetical protein VGX95_06480 [Xanthobacteraceae bacterium]|jgi:hypothetical protein|nr:hypothetical protein [Xanthobacteraceae bacterium]
MSQLASFFIFRPGYSQVATTALQAANGDYLLAGRLSPQSGPAMGTALRLRGGNVVWEKNYPGQFSTSFSSMAALPNGTFILTGIYFTSNLAGDEKTWLVNLDGEGNVLWEGQYGRPGYQDDGYAVVATSDGGFVVAGLNREHGVDKLATTLVRKFDAQRRLQWSHEFFDGVCFAIAQTSDGGYILSGAHRIAGSLNSNPYVLRLDTNGNKVWSRAFTGTEIYVLPHSSVTQTRDGNFLVVAKQALIKVDGAGNILWERRNDIFDLHSVLELPDQSIAVGGVFALDNNDHAYVAVLNATGETIQWDNTALQLPSAFTQLFVDRRYRLVAASGFGPLDGDRSQMLLAVFYPATTFSKMAATPEPGASNKTTAA